MNDSIIFPHPQWYDPRMDYAHARFGFALRIGSGAAAVSNDWGLIESILRVHWLVVHEGLTWEEARPAVYHGWLAATLAASQPGGG